MSIPLVQNNEKDSINTSIIAIKRNIERINMLLGLSNSEEIDTSKFATKDELQQAVTELQPVDEVTVGNMHSVTSNAVANTVNTVTNDLSDTLQKLTIHKIWGRLGDYETQDIVLQNGLTYLYVNTHVLAIEMIMFSFYNGQITQAWRMTNNSITNITGIDMNTVRFTANGSCRGYIFKIGDTLGT